MVLGLFTTFLNSKICSRGSRSVTHDLYSYVIRLRPYNGHLGAICKIGKNYVKSHAKGYANSHVKSYMHCSGYRLVII